MFSPELCLYSNCYHIDSHLVISQTTLEIGVGDVPVEPDSNVNLNKIYDILFINNSHCLSHGIITMN